MRICERSFPFQIASISVDLEYDYERLYEYSSSSSSIIMSCPLAWCEYVCAYKQAVSLSMLLWRESSYFEPLAFGTYIRTRL